MAQLTNIYIANMKIEEHEVTSQHWTLNTLPRLPPPQTNWSCAEILSFERNIFDCWCCSSLSISVLNSKQPDQFISSLCQTWVFRLKFLGWARKAGRQSVDMFDRSDRSIYNGWEISWSHSALISLWDTGLPGSHWDQSVKLTFLSW